MIDQSLEGVDSSELSDDPKNSTPHSTPQKFRVHRYALVRVPIEVEATSHHEAIKNADSRLASTLDCVLRYPAESAEETLYWLVDEIGDDYYERSRWYDPADVYPSP